MAVDLLPRQSNGHAVSDQRDTSRRYDEDVEDFWKDLPISNVQDAGTNTAASNEPVKDIDEEIKIGKKRRVVAKLDEERLLSEKGIPELRRRAAKRIRLQGKGHEYSDIGRLLDMYQLWLDDLYPRAKFRDGLSMVEKLGHSNRLKVMRKAWMDGTKTLSRREDEDVARRFDGDVANPKRPELSRPGESEEHGLAHDTLEDSQEQQARGAPIDVPEEDELDILLADERPAQVRASANTRSAPAAPFEEDTDDLDALLDEEPLGNRLIPKTQASGRSGGSVEATEEQNHFPDEEEIMAEMGWP